MPRTLSNRLGRRPVVEALETRTLLAAGPRVIDIDADNRGLVVIRMDRTLEKSTVTRRSVKVFTAGDDGKLGTRDDVRRKIELSYRSKKITLDANLKANTKYRVLLKSKLIEDRKGRRLDGEFNGAGKPSGNGKAGGNYAIITRAPQKLIARFSTTAGTMDVDLLKKDARATVKNFLRYANSGAWDGTFFHRLIPGFVAQAGGYRVTDENTVGPVQSLGPVQNEPGISNTRGTLAMAKLPGDPNSATNQWFFNLADNGTNLDGQNGGFTVFGRIRNRAGLRVMDKIASYPRPTGSELPVRDLDSYLQRGQLDPQRDLLTVLRVSILVRVGAGKVR